MRKFLVFMFALLAIGFSTSWAQPQPDCGDADQSGEVDVTDMALILNHISLGAPVPDPGDADCDTRAGLTISDAATLAGWFFTGQTVPCAPFGQYGFTQSLADTIFVPRLSSIPEGIDEVALPVLTSFENNTDAMYLPLRNPGLGNGLFQFNNAIPASPPILSQGLQTADTTVVWALEGMLDALSGQKTVATLVYQRVGAGIGSVQPEWFDRDGLLKIAVEKDGDLFVPVVQYYDYDLPADTLYVSSTSATFNFLAGSAAPTPVDFDFTSSGADVDVQLTPSETWVTLSGDGASFSTPGTVGITVDPLVLPIGTHTAQVVISADPAVEVPETVIDITVNVFQPAQWSQGDMNCDGVVDSADLGVLVQYLFAPPGTVALPVCPQF